MTQHTPARVVALCALAFGLAACDSTQEDANSTPAPATADGIFEANLFETTNSIVSVSNRPDTENRDRLYRLDPSLATRATLIGETRIDDGVPGGVKSFQQAAFAQDGRDFFGTFDGNDNVGKLVRADRRGQIEAITNAGLRPKGVFVDINVGNGYVGVADFGTSEANSQILIYADNFADGAAPAATITNLGTGGRAWDLFYAADEDILFVTKTNGEVAAYDNFVGQVGPVIFNNVPGSTVAPTREFAISNPDANPTTVKRSLNLHGVAYDSDTDILIVSDVANPAQPLSGRIYTIADGNTVGAAPNATGTPSNLVPFRARIRSRAAPDNNNTLLGNPVDILGFGGNLYVAAKGTNRVLRFDNILTAVGQQGNRAPDAAREVEGAESVAFFQR
jgi:hypothetical protein